MIGEEDLVVCIGGSNSVLDMVNGGYEDSGEQNFSDTKKKIENNIIFLYADTWL